METRKVQAVGASTLSISLPKKWANSNNIDKGDQVFLIEEGDYLKVVSAKTRKEESESGVLEYVINADLCKEKGMLERVIVGNYVLGREKMTVKSGGRLKSEHLHEIRNVSWRLIGLGILEETASEMSLQCSIDPSKYPLESLLKRLLNIGSTMLDEAIEALMKSDKKLADDVIRREDDADMMYWLCLRLILSAQDDDSLMKKLGVERRYELAGNRLVAKDLETVADLSKEIANCAIALTQAGVKIPNKLSKAIKDYSSSVKDLYEKSLTVLLARDIESANRIIESKEGLRRKEERIEKLMFEDIKDSFALLHMRNVAHNLEKIAEMALSISVIAINRFLESPSELCMPADSNK
jgi:phosphate uptake regulator